MGRPKDPIKTEAQKGLVSLFQNLGLNEYVSADEISELFLSIGVSESLSSKDVTIAFSSYSNFTFGVMPLRLTGKIVQGQIIRGRINQMVLMMSSAPSMNFLGAHPTL